MLVGRGGLRGTKIVNKTFVNKLAFPIHVLGPDTFFHKDVGVVNLSGAREPPQF